MNRWMMLVLSLWGAQAFARPDMKGEFVEAKVITPSYTCQAGPFEVSFNAIEAKLGQQIRFSFEAAATGVRLGYRVNTTTGVLHEGGYRLPSPDNTIDPCAPISEAPAPQTNSVTVAPKPQSVGPVTVIPGPVTLTVVTPPANAPMIKDHLTITLPQVAAGAPMTVTIWSEKPILAKSLHFALEEIVPVDPVAYAEWEAKQLAKAEAKAARVAKRASKREARQEARAIKLAIKAQEKEKKSVAVAAAATVEAKASFEVKTQRAAKAQSKMTLRMERRNLRAEKRELRLAPKRAAKLIQERERQARLELKIERRNKKRIIRYDRRETRIDLRREKRELRLAPKRAAKIIKERERQIRIELKIERRNKRRLVRHDRREIKIELRREKRVPLKLARIERRKDRHEVRINVRIERRDRRVIRVKARHIAREPKIVIRSHKRWERYVAKDKKIQRKIQETNKLSRKDWLESRRYNMFVSNLDRVEGVYESLATAELKAEFKVELFDKVVAMQPEKEAAYKLYVDARNLENAQINAAASLERESKAQTNTIASAQGTVDVETGVKIPPQPAPLTEVLAPSPVPGAAWSAGYWHWSGAQYVWIEGRWIFPAVKVSVQKEQKPSTLAKPAGYSTGK